MKHVIAITLAVASITANAEFTTGNMLLDDLRSSNNIDKAYALGYVAGALDSVTNVTVCPPKNLTQGQAAEMVKQHLESNPQTRHYSADSLIINMFRSVWPCAGGGRGA